MKRMNLYIAMLFTSLFMGACEKPDPSPPDPPAQEEKVIDIEWSTRLDQNREIANHNNGVYYKNQYVFFGDLDDPATIYAFDVDTGDMTWEYKYDGWDDSDVEKNYFIDNILICVTARRLFGFDLEEQESIWEINLAEKNVLRGSGAIAKNGLFYQLGNLDFNPSGGGTAKLYEIDPLTGDYKEVYSRSPDEAGTKGISPPVEYEDVENDRTLLIFNERPNAETPPQHTIQYIVAMDLETKERVWETLVTPVFASNGLHPPVIYDNRIVITGGHDKMFGFDVVTGEKLWMYQDENALGLGQWINTNHLIHDNRLYVNETGEDVTCLNPENGALIWDNIKGGANCTDNMVYYEKEDLLVFCSWGYGSVMVLDALTGETLQREHRYDDSSYTSDVVYDEERDMFYCTTYKHAVAFTVKRVK